MEIVADTPDLKKMGTFMKNVPICYHSNLCVVKSFTSHFPFVFLMASCKCFCIAPGFLCFYLEFTVKSAKVYYHSYSSHSK